MSCKSVLQGCHGRVSRKNVKKECLTRVSSKSVLESRRVSSTSVPQKSQRRVSSKSVLPERSAIVSSKGVLQECHLSVSSQGVPQVVSLGNVTHKYCLCYSTCVSAFGFVGFILFFFEGVVASVRFPLLAVPAPCLLNFSPHTVWGHLPV